MNFSRLRYGARMLTALIGLVPIAACQSIADKVDVHLTELNASTDNFRNQAILLNILRSKQGAPLSFVNVTSIPTQYNADISYALPSYQIGPLKIQSGRPFGIGNTTFGGDFNNQTQPTFNNLVGKEFNNSVTEPVLKTQLLRLARDGYPIELLLLLSTSRVSLIGRQGRFIIQNQDLERIVNCPLPDGKGVATVPVAGCLQIIRDEALRLGIDLEEIRTNKVIQSDNEGDKKAKKVTEQKDARFCFTQSSPFKRPDNLSNFIPGSPGSFCGSASSRRGEAEIANVELRSLVGVYRFLGEYLRNPQLREFMVVNTPRGPEDLLVIAENAAVPCFVEVSYLNKRYCVPDDNSGQTKQVFAILDQLQNVNTDVSKIPQPSVLTLNGRLR